MLPYIIVAAGLGLLLTMVMNLRLAKRQQGVQKSLVDVATTHDQQLAAVQKEAGDARTTAQVARQEAAATVAAQEPIVKEVRARVDGVEQRFHRFEEALADAAKRTLATEERLHGENQGTTKGLEDLKIETKSLSAEAKSLGAEVRAVRDDSERQLAKFSQRLGSIESSLQSLGLSGSRTPKLATPPSRATSRHGASARDAGGSATGAPSGDASGAGSPTSAHHDVVASMAAPTLAASGTHRESKVASKTSHGATASEPRPALYDTEADDEIDEGSARWIFVVLGLMLALAIAANIASS